jgi:gluconokinase
VIIVLMGPAGAGKSTVGAALAAALQWPFIDADDLHPQANLDRMRRGIALTDRDRAPWLARVHDRIDEMSRPSTRLGAGRGSAVLACSALRAGHRAVIANGVPDVRWVLLDAPVSVLAERLRTRRGHFAGPELLPSQLDALEPPPDAVIIAADQPVPAIVEQILGVLRLEARAPQT